LFVGVGYASPATLRVFDEFAKNHDLDHNWEQVAIDFYTILERTHESMTSGWTAIGEQIFTGEHPFSNGLLLPAWTLPTGQSLDSGDFNDTFSLVDGNTYESYLNFARDSARLPIHLMMDYAWYPSEMRGGEGRPKFGLIA